MTFLLEPAVPAMVSLNPCPENACSTVQSFPCGLPGSLDFLWCSQKQACCHRRCLSLRYTKARAARAAWKSSSRPNKSARFVVMSAIPKWEDLKIDEDLSSVPCQVNPSLTVASWGRLYQGPHSSKYWNHYKSFPYPVGYTAIKVYKGKTYRQSITEGPEGPLFVVEDLSDNGRVFSASSAQKVWDDVAVGMGLQVKGSRHFGFQTPQVIQQLRLLPQEWTQKDKGLSPTQVVDDNADRDTDASFHDDDDGADGVDNDEDDEGRISHQSLIFNNASVEDDHVNHVFSEMLEGGQQGEDEEEEDEEEVEEDDVVDESRDLHDDDDDDNDEDDIEEDEDVVDDTDSVSDEDEADGVDHLAFDVFPKKGRNHVDDDSPSFLQRGRSINNLKQSFRSPNRDFSYGRVSRGNYDFDKYDSTDDSVSNNVPYSSQASRLKNVGTAEKKIWRKGEGLTGNGMGHTKRQSSERSGMEQWNSLSDAGQLKNTSVLSTNGVKSWEGTFPRRKDETPKSSQLLLELLQRWNKIKKWNHDSGDRSRGRGDSKHTRLRVENDVGRRFEDTSSDGRTFSSVNKSPSESLHSASRGSSSQTMRGFQGQEAFHTSNVSFLDDGASVLDELRISHDVDESTDYAITRLFEMVGKKNTVHDRASPTPEVASINTEDRGTSEIAASKSFETLNSLQADASYQGARTLLQDDATVGNYTDKSAFNTATDRLRKESDSERAVDPVKVSEMTERDVDVQRRSDEEIRLIERVRKLAVSKRFEDALSAVKDMKLSGINVDEDVYEAALGLKLDSWQRQVSKLLKEGNSVLVSAPDGVGKSAAAECCLYRAVVEEQRALFVTPYENLAKEKLCELESMFGHGNVGGVGTRKRVQKEQKLVVLTLQNLANILLELNGPGGSEFRFFFEGVKMVVLDKFHTFGESKYGSLWEQVLLLMDIKIKVVALTLPANNEDEVVSWINVNRGPCKLVNSAVEPVPKRYLFGHNTGLLPLLDPKGVRLNAAFSEGGRGYEGSMEKEQIDCFFSSGYDRPSLRRTLSVLEDNAMLPAVIVFFDVKGCVDAISDALDVLPEGLLSKSEKSKVESCLGELADKHPDFAKHIDEADRQSLLKGFATYHEGKLPMWQKLVLKLFKRNLIKLLVVTESILFHTEIVSRTIILPVTCKVLKDGVSSIPCGQVLQLIGRAGRRGYDIEGNIVFLRSFYTGPEEAASLVLNNNFNISSHFKPSYSLVVNLMAKHKLSEVKKVLGRSFSDFVYYNSSSKAKKIQELDKKILHSLEAKADLEVKLFQGLTEVNKQKLSDAAMFTRVDIRMTIHSASQVSNVLPGILLAVVPGQSESFYMVFGADNNFRLLPAGALDHVYLKEAPPLNDVYKQSTGQILQPPLIPPKESWILEHDGTYGYVASGNSETREYVRLLMEHPVQANLSKEGLHIRKDILLLEAQTSNLVETRRNIQANEKPVLWPESNKTVSQTDESETWKESVRLLNILERVDALSIINSQGAYVKLKPLGMLISRLHNVENELWLASAVTSMYVKQLLPAEFIGIIATMVPEEPEVVSLFSDQRELLYRITRPVRDAFTNLEVIRKQVAALQGSYTPPLHFDPALAGMVYAWARGKPGTSGFNLVSSNDGDVAWKLRSVIKLANLVYKACSQVSVDISEPNDFNNLSTLARRAEESLSRHLSSVEITI